MDIPPPLETAKPKPEVSPTHPFAEALKRTKQRQWLLIGGGILLTVIGLIYYFYFSGRSRIIIADTSPDLEITLNNREVNAKLTDDGYSISAFAGTYRLQLVKPHYLPYVEDINLERGRTLTVRPAFAFQPTSQQTEVSTVDYVRPSADEKSIFYLGDNRKTIYRMDIASQVKVPLTDKPLSGVTDVQWSSEPDVALITQRDGVYLREIPKFDYVNQTLVRLGGSEIISPIWDPLNPGRIAFAYYLPNGEKSLVFTDKRLSSLVRKADLTTLSNPKLIWSSNDRYIMLLDRGNDKARNNIWLYDTQNGSLSQITQEGQISDASFSPGNDTILYENGTGQLTTMNVDGNEKKALNISGKVARTAWKDSSSFYLPNGNNSLKLYYLSGKTEDIRFSFPSNLNISGMHYFNSSKTLIFYTSDSVYTVELGV